MKQYLTLTDVTILDELPKLTEDRKNRDWLPEEQVYIITGIDLAILASYLPGRSVKAIARQASEPRFEYSARNVDGVIYLFEGIQRRGRNKGGIHKVDTAITVSDTDTITSSAKLTALETITSESNDIVSNNVDISKGAGVIANARAIQILQENALNVEPEIVFSLSKHIIKYLKDIL